MPFPSGFSSLPASLLLLILTTAVPSCAEPQWPYNLPAQMRYFPEDEPLVKRGLESMQKLGKQAPVGVQKMSTDPNDMFFLDYWQFNDTDSSTSYQPSANETSSDLIPPPLLVHLFQDMPQKRAWFGAPLVKRDFQCPANYISCAGLGASSLCCPQGNTCINIKDSGSGTVGCCPAGQNCANGVTVGSCDSSQGYQSCPGNSNGGCCIPGYSCFSTGCKYPSS
jgi:hypothetical protein